MVAHLNPDMRVFGVSLDGSSDSSKCSLITDLATSTITTCEHHKFNGRRTISAETTDKHVALPYSRQIDHTVDKQMSRLWFLAAKHQLIGQSVAVWISRWPTAWFWRCCAAHVCLRTHQAPIA
jgi:predicted ATPase